MFAADNIRLRALEPEDLEWLYSVENDEELWQWGSSNVPYCHNFRSEEHTSELQSH